MADAAQDAGVMAEQQRQQELIKKLAAMPEDQAIKTIQEQITPDVGKYGAEAVAAAEHNLAQVVARYKEEHGVHVTGFADVLVREKVGASVNYDQQGNPQYGVSSQAHVGQVRDVNVFAGGSLGLDNTGVKGGSAWVNGIGKPFDIGDAHVIPVSQLAVNVPASGKMDLGNVTGMVGAVINPEGTHGNIAALVSATADGKSANAFVDYSHDFALGNGATVTPHAGVTQQFMGDQGTSLSGGLRMHDPHLLGKTTGMALELTAGSTNLRDNNPGWSAGAQVEVTFNNPEKKAVSSLEEAFMNATGKGRTPSAADQLTPTTSNISDAGKPPVPPREEPVLTASTPAKEPVSLAQDEKRIFNLTEQSFTQGLRAAADLYNSLPDEKLKQQFKHDFDANLAKSPVFGNIKASSEFTSQEFASRATEQQREQHVASL